jgi:ubiquitin-like-conjugating enzyme ATG3
MKNITQNLARKGGVGEDDSEGGGVPRTDHYLFIFLKFLQSIIPTIDYDFTVEVEAGGRGGVGGGRAWE